METFSIVITILCLVLATVNLIASVITDEFETKVMCLLWAIILTLPIVGY